MSKEIKTGKDYLQKKYPEMKGDKWNTHEVINDNWIAEQMDEYVEYRLKAQEEKHKEEMEKFNMFVSKNFMYSEDVKKWYGYTFFFHGSIHYQKYYTFTELIKMFKKSLDIK